MVSISRNCRPSGSAIRLCMLGMVVGLALGALGCYFILVNGNKATALALNIEAGRLYDAGDLDKSLGLAYQAIALNPADYSPYSLLGRIYSSSGKKQLALQVYETALANTYNDGNFYARDASVIEADRKRIQEKISALRSM